MPVMNQLRQREYIICENFSFLAITVYEIQPEERQTDSGGLAIRLDKTLTNRIKDSKLDSHLAGYFFVFERNANDFNPRRGHGVRYVGLPPTKITPGLLLPKPESRDRSRLLFVRWKGQKLVNLPGPLTKIQEKRLIKDSCRCASEMALYTE
ncbi:unnamed protein product [Chrysodeixis includens]|uniref:Uncharacterized protein n=1 Tax=Chrysodeixis includens TaxID=689277 RepID=A0A9N8PZG9_CHRIL|nr:unnamed protein product [Chrysodeixis includens]